eukprot:4256211-Prymnesium_polylepis.1
MRLRAHVSTRRPPRPRRPCPRLTTLAGLGIVTRTSRPSCGDACGLVDDGEDDALGGGGAVSAEPLPDGTYLMRGMVRHLPRARGTAEPRSARVPPSGAP